MATRRERQKTATRRAVLDAASELFDERGYAETTMRAVAERAGVGLGTIFVHFPDKASLLLATLEIDVGDATREGLATMPATDLRAQLLHVSARLYRFYARRPRLSRVLLQNALFLDGTEGFSPGSDVRAFLRVLEELFVAAIERGEVRRDVAPADAALGFFADYFAILIGGLQSPSVDVDAFESPSVDVDALQAQLARLLDLRFAGMRPTGSRKV